MTEISNYALGVVARGADVAAGEERRLRTIIAATRSAVSPDSRIAGLLEAADLVPECACDVSRGLVIDALSRIVVSAQRAVGHESRASVHLFLPADQAEKWRSYADYRRYCDDFFERTAVRRLAA